MLKNTMRSMLFLIAATGLAACDGPTGDGDIGLDVSGDWQETWTCTETCPGADPEEISGTTDMVLTQDGPSVTREDTDGTTWSGTLDGNVLTLTVDALDYEETSTFTFSPETGRATSFTIESEYSYMSEGGSCTGTCTGNGTGAAQ